MAEIKKINTEFQLLDKFLDTSGDAGTSGQVLSSTASGVNWVDGSAIPGVPGGSGTLNTIPLWTPDGDTLGNSIITQPVSSEIRVAGKLKVDSPVTGYSSTKIQTGGFSDSQSGINILNSTTGYGYILFGDGSGADLYKGQIAYKHGDDFMAFNTNGSQKMTINSIGYVGIGTTSPGAKLEVEGRVDFSNDLRLRGTDSSANQGVSRFYVDSSNKLYIDTANDGNNMFVIDSGGNVGIGATPRIIGNYRVLDISGSSGAGGYIGLSSGSTQQGVLYAHSA